MKNAKKADQYLGAKSTELQNLLNKVLKLSALETQLVPFFPKELWQYCQVGNFQQNSLILIVANGSIATQIRFMAPDLIRKFKSHPQLKTIAKIECKVRPFNTITHRIFKPHSKPMALLSPASAAMVANVAHSIDDEKLRESLLKIAKHIKS